VRIWIDHKSSNYRLERQLNIPVAVAGNKYSKSVLVHIHADIPVRIPVDIPVDIPVRIAVQIAVNVPVDVADDSVLNFRNSRLNETDFVLSSLARNGLCQPAQISKLQIQDQKNKLSI
jgi:hypothetical protein